jgi:hypothetical protein
MGKSIFKSKKCKGLQSPQFDKQMQSLTPLDTRRTTNLIVLLPGRVTSGMNCLTENKKINSNKKTKCFQSNVILR